VLNAGPPRTLAQCPWALLVHLGRRSLELPEDLLRELLARIICQVTISPAPFSTLQPAEYLDRIDAALE
jgi:hypothetical protein